MLSRLRQTLIYTDTDPDVLDHDDDMDAEIYTFENREVYRGTFDPRYTSQNLDVHWLYDDNSKRVGLVEYESTDFSKFSVLWYYDNPYATLLQEPDWKQQGKTLWSMLSEEAYQDCLDDDFKNVVEKSLHSPYRLVFPSTYFKEYIVYECVKCRKRTLTLENACPTMKKVETPFFSLFLDDSFILYSKSTQQAQESQESQQSHGDDDHFTKASSLELHGLIKGSTLRSLPGGHLPHITSPDLFADMIVAHIASVTAPVR
jgi:hypothetical protein